MFRKETCSKYALKKKHVYCSRSVRAILRKESTGLIYTLTYTKGILKSQLSQQKETNKTFEFCIV